MKLKSKHLPHRVKIERYKGEGSDGVVTDVAVEVPAYVEQKSKLIIDRRSASNTYSTEILATTFIVLGTVNDVHPGDYITVWVGTARERRAEVIDSALFDYRGTPNHVEVWTE